MSYFEQYIADNVDDPCALMSMNAQIAQLGFDTTKGIPKPFSLYQITEGFDVYDVIRQNLNINVLFGHKPATVTFIFCGVRDDNDTDFKLTEINAKLYGINDNITQRVAEQQFGSKGGFPSKDQMVKAILDEAIRLTSNNPTIQKSKTLIESLKNSSISQGRQLRP